MAGNKKKKTRKASIAARCATKAPKIQKSTAKKRTVASSVTSAPPGRPAGPSGPSGPNLLRTPNASGIASRSRLLKPKSEILRHASHAVSRMIQADATGKHGASLKSLTLGKDVHAKHKKAVYAVTVETLKYYTVLAEVLDGITIPTAESRAHGKTDVLKVPDVPVSLVGALSMPTACVLAKELLLGDGFSKQWIGPAERLVMEAEGALRGRVAELLAAKGVNQFQSQSQSLHALLPNAQNALMAAAKMRKRTVRVNAPLVAGSVEEVMEVLQEEFQGRNGGTAVGRNAYVEDVLELPAGSDLHAHRLVKDGSVVLQSLASCMPAVALMCGEEGWRPSTVVDACAAPGNKTTHVASLMAQNNVANGTVYAFDRDPVRLERLKANVETTRSGGIITARCADFLTVDPCTSPYDGVDAILLDPSCSGSGTSVSRMDYLLPSANEVAGRGVMYTDNRVKQLSAFQESAIRHAMSWPSVKRVVYSTCSVYVEENERVVARVLAEGRERGFELVSCIPTWPRRGLSVVEDGEDGLSEADAAKVVRIDPLEDGTDGFFVCAWQRQIGRRLTE